MTEPLTIDLPTVAGPRGRVLPDWGMAPGGVAPGWWVLAPDQPGGGVVRVVVKPGSPPTVATASAPKPARVPLPVCSHRGPEVRGRERAANNLPHARTWFTCRHPELPKGKYVCPCRGCGPKCKGYRTG